ncbi:MAG: PRC-barrel domain-containing protein [Pirellulales bacterium]|nr:PRC-barrel domain-containing protein [Pirellulales bacterium]
MMIAKKLALAGSCLALFTVVGIAGSLAADEGKSNAPSERPTVAATRSFRTSTLEGMKVYNKAGEEVGKINELVVNIENGKVEYAALSVGGFLGVGDKLFAVPFRMFALRFDEDKTYMLLDVNKQTLERAPGFNQDHWPDIANANWAQEIEKYYGGASHDGTFVRMDGETLVMRDAAGESTHTHVLANEVKFTSGGKTVAADTLREGDRIRVTTTERDGKSIATSIEILSTRS